MKKVTVVIPCHNEAEGITGVITGFPRRQLKAHGYELEVLVINNRSTDNTPRVARSAGARVVNEPKKGKGNAIRTGFYSIPEDTDYVVMLDGDDTYRPEEIIRLLEPINSGFCNVVIGSRLGGRIQQGSMTAFNRLGNWVFSHLVRYSYRVNVTDVLTGYFAWNRDAIVRLRPHLQSAGFAIEMEMITKMARLGEEIYSVPISYNSRAGESNLRPIRDGMRILSMYLRNLSWNPPKPPVERIAFVSDSIMPYNKGGKEKRLYEISKRLVKRGREVHIYTMKWWDGPKHRVEDGVHLHAIAGYRPLYSGERRSIREAVSFGAATLKMLFKRFDVIDVDHMPFFPLFSARLVCWLRRKPLHATWHEVTGSDAWQNHAGRGIGSIGYLVEQLTMKVPDVIISNSSHTTHRLRRAGVKKTIRTVPLGVSLDEIYAAKTSPKTSDVIFAGRLLHHKNVDMLIRAIAIARATHPTLSCLIVGNGPEKPRLQQLVTELNLGDHVRLMNFVQNHRDLYSLMKASKVFVLPSIREGFSITVVEANAAGLPVITTSHPDNAARDLIREGENGCLVEPTAEALADAIIRVLGGVGLEPTKNIERYDWNVVTKAVEKALKV
jgi:glycosyltransferase involved in cell wall biosynthesis